MMPLVVGASGATGRLLVKQLLNRGLKVKVIVRAPERLPEDLRNHENLSLICANVLDLSDGELAQLVNGCGAVASCLGHNLTLQGMYGQPRRLVTDATRRLCAAIQSNKPPQPVRFVLMNTAGNSNRDIPEKISLAQQVVVGLIRVLLPPHADNEQAAEYLRTGIGQNHAVIEWTTVRPDSLIDENEVSECVQYASPIRSSIFDPGKTSRINVAHFMAALMTEDELWHRWKGQMPVIYNKASA